MIFSKNKRTTELTPTDRTARKGIWIAVLSVLTWMMLSSVTGSLFWPLSTVQKNDNSKFLPASVESEKFTAATKAFTQGQNLSLPELVLFIGDGSDANVAKVNAYLQTIPSKPLVDIKGKAVAGVTGTIGDFLTPRIPLVAFPSQNKQAILASIPFDSSKTAANLSNKKPALPAVTDAIRYYTQQFATANGFTRHVTGFAALIADLFSAFGSLDSSLLLTTGGVVALILIIVYRSPILWILPLFAAGTALTFAGSII